MGRFDNLVISSNAHIDHINEATAKGQSAIDHHRELDIRLQEIVTSNVNAVEKRVLIQQALGTQQQAGGTSGIPGAEGILTAIEKQNCYAPENEFKQSCIKLIENYNKFLADIGDVFSDGPSNLRPKHLVNISPSEVTLFKEDHKIVEIDVFWYSEFDRENLKAEIIDIKTIPNNLGIDFEGTPKTLSGANDKIHAIIDGEFIEPGMSEIEVEVKIQVGDQVATARDMLVVELIDTRDRSFIDTILEALGIQ